MPPSPPPRPTPHVTPQPSSDLLPSSPARLQGPRALQQRPVRHVVRLFGSHWYGCGLLRPRSVHGRRTAQPRRRLSLACRAAYLWESVECRAIYGAREDCESLPRMMCWGCCRWTSRALWLPKAIWFILWEEVKNSLKVTWPAAFPARCCFLVGLRRRS